MSRNIFAFWIAFVFSLTWIPVHAQGSEPPIPERPPQGTYILDSLNWLTAPQEAEINRIISRLDQEGFAQIEVVTLDDCGTDKRNFRKSILQNWQIGHPDDQDGLLILVCWYGGDTSRRSVEQEFGPGMNGILSSDLTDRIAKENFIPAFQNDQPGNGLLAMVVTYDGLLRKKETVPETTKETTSGNIFYTILGPLFCYGLLPLAALAFVIRFVHKNSSGGDGGYYYGGDYGGGDAGGGGDSGSSTSF